MDTIIPLLLTFPSSVNDRPLRLELAACEAMLCVILDHLGKKLTPEERVSSPLGKLLAADNPAEIEKLVAQINDHLKAQRKDLAILKLREMTGITWDDLHVLADRWKEMTVDQQKHTLRLARIYQTYRELRASHQIQ